MKVSLLICIICISSITLTLYSSCQETTQISPAILRIDSLAFLSFITDPSDTNHTTNRISIEAIDTIIDYYEKIHNTDRLAYAYFYKAKFHFQDDSDSLSILYTLKAIDMTEESNDLRLSVETHNLSGLIYLLQNLPQNARQEFEKAYDLTDSIPFAYYYKPLFLRNIARTYHLRYVLFRKRQDTDTAIIYYNRAIKALTDSTPRLVLRSIYREITTTCLFRKDFVKALEYLKNSKDSTDMITYYSQKADIYMYMNLLDSADFYSRKCLLKQTPDSKYSTYYKLYNIERIRSNNSEALKYADTLFILGDSIIARTIPDKVIKIQKKYNEQKLRAEKANLQVKYEKEKSH